MALFSFSLLVFLLICTISLFLLMKKRRNKILMEGVKLPPSPPTFPIIGNIHQIGKFPLQSLSQLSQKYGPIMLLKLGSISTIVISSADMAKEVFKTHDLDCCNRPPTPGFKKLSYSSLDVAFPPYSKNWGEMRKLFVSEFLSSKKEQTHWAARVEEVNLLIGSISQAFPKNPVNFSEEIFGAVDGIIGKVGFGKSYGGKKFNKQKFRFVLDETMNILDSYSAEDCFPVVGRIIDALMGFRTRLDKNFGELDGHFEMVLDEHLHPARPKQNAEDLVDTLVKLWKEQSGGYRMTKDHVKAFLMNTFLGGVETTAITILLAMSELVKNPRVLTKVQAEIGNCVRKKPQVEGDDIGKFKYLKMVVKETLRLHPPAPLLIPHETIRHCKLGGYDVFPKTRILINARAIGRDLNYWKNPDEFYPERFQNNEIDFTGQHFEFLLFGGGRRICPAINMGTTTVEFILANLLYCFDWEPPAGMEREDISMEGDGGISIFVRKPLLVLCPLDIIGKSWSKNNLVAERLWSS